MQTNIGRECTKCHIFKEWNDFRFIKNGRNWRSWSCRDCEKKPFKIKKSRTYTSDRNLNEFKWETPKPTSYELSWQKDAIDLDRPHHWIYDHMN